MGPFALCLFVAAICLVGSFAERIALRPCEGETAPMAEYIDVEGCINRCNIPDYSYRNVTVGIRLDYKANKLRPNVMVGYNINSYELNIDETKNQNAPSDICGGSCPQSNELREYKFRAYVTRRTYLLVSAEVVAKLFDENGNVAMCTRFYVYIS